MTRPRLMQRNLSISVYMTMKSIKIRKGPQRMTQQSKAITSCNLSSKHLEVYKRLNLYRRYRTYKTNETREK